jgi:ferredoxin
MTMAEIEVDLRRCEGHGLCEEAAPELFALDDAGELIVKAVDVPADLLPQAQAAARSCPVAAIRIRREGGGA